MSYLTEVYLRGVWLKYLERRLWERASSAFRLHILLHPRKMYLRSEEHTSELQSHRDLHSFPTRRSSDLLPSGGLVEIFGEKAVGKSILCFQVAYSVASKKNVLIIDTELGYERSLLPYWSKPLAERFSEKVTVLKVQVEKRFDDNKKRRANEAVLKEAIRNLLSSYHIETTDSQLGQMVSIAAPSFKLAAQKNANCIYLLEEPGLIELMQLH